MSAVLNVKYVCDGCGATVAERKAARASAWGFADAALDCDKEMRSKNVLVVKRVRRATLHYCNACADRKTGKRVSLAFGV